MITLRRKRLPRPAFTVRDEHDFPAAVARVDELVCVAVRHPDPLVRDRFWCAASREAAAIRDFLAGARAMVPVEQRASVEAAYRDWRSRVDEYGSPVTHV